MHVFIFFDETLDKKINEIVYFNNAIHEYNLK